MVVIVLLRREQPSTEERRLHHVHGVGARGQLLQGGPLTPVGRPRGAAELLAFVGGAPAIGQAVHQQVGYLFKLAAGGHVQDVVATGYRSLPERPTVHRAVLPAAVPERATDFFGLKPVVSEMALITCFLIQSVKRRPPA